MTRLAHSILFGAWAMEPTAAEALLPQAVRLLKGELPRLTKAQMELARAAHEPRRISAALSGAKEGASNDTQPKTASIVLVLPINGPVTKYGGMCSYGMSDYARWLREADANPDVLGVVLDIDTPGGEVDGMTLMQDTIAAMEKPVVGIVQSGIAASAGMGIAAMCDELYASRATDQFGSIGMFCTLADYRKYFQTQGLDIHQVYATRSTDKNKAYKEALKADPNDPNDEHYALLKAEMDSLVEAFVGDVKKARPAMAATEKEWSTGRMFPAADAQRLGLIDGMNTMSGAVARVRSLAREREEKANTPKPAQGKANSATTNANPSTNMNFKESITGFVAGIKNLFTGDADVNEAAIAGANAALKAEGYTTLEVIAADRVAAVQDAEARIAEADVKTKEATDKAAALEADLATAKADLEKANASLAEANTKLEAAATEATKQTEAIAAKDAEIEKLKNEPATEPAAAHNPKGDTDPAMPEDAETEAFKAEVRKALAE